MREFVEAAFAVVNLPSEKYVRHSATFTRPSEPALLVGSPQKIRRVLNWQPTSSFSELVQEMVETELKKTQKKRTQT